LSRERSDLRRLGREPRRRALASRSVDARFAQVAREPAQLRGDLFGLAGERSLAEQRAPRGDRLGRRLRGQIEGDVRRCRRRECSEPLVVECRDRAEARVLSGELSPAGAGLVEFELGRDV